ncbi:hypothetical protein ASG87_01470 [Frateuria sp. Soil773]|uniref:hypothetical protein n=1 Tax=Frateuria sp. Soil773 TaxID=1736407 RepID=UPI0006F25B65|nr:hypothetical protein [Frateuria sp. Soil773]KRE90833.1 hypothetical protein ASG87_01470 [Frateuria sp. Soil773]
MNKPTKRFLTFFLGTHKFDRAKGYYVMRDWAVEPPPAPTFLDLVFQAELKFFAALAANRVLRETADEAATETLVEAWDRLIALLREGYPAKCQEEAAVLRDEIFAALDAGADPKFVDAQSFIQGLSIMRVLFSDGPITGFALLTALVEAGYSLRGEELDDITKSFGQEIYRPLTGQEWLDTRGDGFHLRIHDKPWAPDAEVQIMSLSDLSTQID